MQPGWSRYARRRIEYLGEWRRYARIVAEAAKSIVNAEVYIVGGAAEGRLTVLSDIDVIVAVEEPIPEGGRKRIAADILWASIEKGLPLDYPIEIHIVSREELKEYLRRGASVKIT